NAAHPVFGQTFSFASRSGPEAPPVAVAADAPDSTAGVCRSLISAPSSGRAEPPAARPGFTLATRGSILRPCHVLALRTRPQPLLHRGHLAAIRSGAGDCGPPRRGSRGASSASATLEPKIVSARPFSHPPR